MSWWALLLLAWGVAAALQLCLWLWQRRTGSATIVDVGWAGSLAGISVLYAILGQGGLEHRLLVGPRTTTDLGRSGTVVEATHSERHTTLLVRDGGVQAAPGWQASPVGLEDLVLAYLRRPARTGAESAALAEVSA